MTNVVINMEKGNLMEVVIEQIRKTGIIPVVVIEDVKDAVPLAKALMDGGLNCAEVTFRTEAAIDALKEMSAAYPKLLLGAGTILTGIRGAVGCSDRANAAISKAAAEGFDFEYIFGELGVRWLHTGGIYAALSEQSCETVLEAIKTAKKYGTIVSYDLNFRPSMWNAIGGIKKAQEVNKEIAGYVDVMIGNEEDFTACLGFDIEGNDADLKELNLDGYKKMINEVSKMYPNFKVIATTLREVKSATINDWSALCFADGEIYKSKDYKELEIMDRVGGGDSFASGLIYGLMATGDVELAVNYGAAHGALAMTTPGDTTMADKREVEAVMGG